MGFWNLKGLKLQEFRPDIKSRMESRANLIMAFQDGLHNILHDPMKIHPYISPCHLDVP